MNVFRVEIVAKPGRASAGDAAALLREAGLGGVEEARESRLFFLEGDLDPAEAQQAGEQVLADPVNETSSVLSPGDSLPAASGLGLEVHLRPGVMDPVAESAAVELRSAGFRVESVRTARRYDVIGTIDSSALAQAAGRVLANDCIEEVVVGTAGVRRAPRPARFEFKLRHVEIRILDHAGLERLSRDGHLFLSLQEMQAVQAHFRALGRAPTDLELETLAQTWSEHCVHKTLKSSVIYRGAAMPAAAGSNAPRGAACEPHGDVEIRYENLLKDTIARATGELMEAGIGPECLSVFKDNAGIITFDERFGVAFKVETHNHPSAIEPYGGAATGAGGCIRDVIGCGLGARPIANTDVFCVAPSNWPQDELPKGVLHPWRILRGVVRGVADYGNRMGIPTVNGAVHFDPRYLGNPLVFCGCVGLIPRDRIEKAAQPGDHIVLVGGRTGRDGIHGATFSSAELTDTHADEFSHAVQIGNAITEKRFMDAILRARDANEGCLYSAITDCGAGGLSSAVGEMAAEIGAEVELESVPLKYAGLRYDEIWISEAQERMVLAVPPVHLDPFLRIMGEEEVEATVIGRFGTAESGAENAAAELVVRYAGHEVGRLRMDFLHDGLPRRERIAEWQPRAARREDSPAPRAGASFDWKANLLRALSSPSVASKAWIFRSYDHEVQGGSVIKPVAGPGRGPTDAAVLRPRLDSERGVALAVGMAPQLFDSDPYWMAIAAIDEAIRNVVCVGGSSERIAILDNFCWGRCDDPRQMGALVRACQACYDASVALGVPFISGKDSLNNEFALDPADVERVIGQVAASLRADPVGAQFAEGSIDEICERIRRTARLSIPGTLLISAIGLIDDVRGCLTPDLKRPGSALYLLGGLDVLGTALSEAGSTHRAVSELLRTGTVHACHDVSEAGWLATVAEMAIGGGCGVEIEVAGSELPDALTLQNSAYVVELANESASEALANLARVRAKRLGRVIAERSLRIGRELLSLEEIERAWRGPTQMR